MKTLILYYSRNGNNRMLANYLAEKLDADIEEIRPKHKFRLLGFLTDFFRNRDPDIYPISSAPKNYDHVLIIAPIFDLAIAHPMRTALGQVGPELDTYSFISLCGYYRDGQASHILEELQTLTGKPPAHIQELWVGELLPEDKRENVMAVGGHNVTESELGIYGNKITQILQWFA